MAVVRAARDLFERDGFRSTTITDVGRRAGVSPETIYKAFGTKAELAKAVFDLVIGGDEDVPVAQQSRAHAIRAEPEVGRKVAMYVDGYVERVQRSASVQILIRDGRHVDESLRIIWQQMTDESLLGMEMLAQHLAATGRLRVSAEQARDILWNYISVDQYERLVLQRGWPIERFTSWLRNALESALLT